MVKYKPQRNLRLDDETYLKVKFLADKESRSFNNMVEIVLKNYVANYEQQHGEIKVDTDALYE